MAGRELWAARVRGDSGRFEWARLSRDDAGDFVMETGSESAGSEDRAVVERGDVVRLFEVLDVELESDSDA